jgi:hypothetical protein
MGADDGAERAIVDLLASYQAAVRTGNREGFSDVFHADATVSYPDADSGDLVTATAGAFADEVVALVAAGETVEETTRACHVDVAGDVGTARVDFRLQIADQHYQGTDFFSLAVVGTRWLITQKLYTMKPVSGP